MSGMSVRHGQIYGNTYRLDFQYALIKSGSDQYEHIHLKAHFPVQANTIKQDEIPLRKLVKLTSQLGRKCLLALLPDGSTCT